MAGKRCPSCGKFTFFETDFGRECTKCGFKMILPKSEVKTAKGQQCINCGQYTVVDGVCSKCGAKYVGGDF